MILYILKVTLSSSLFILLYHLLLENERMHSFKRFYLLCAIIGSFLIPLIPFSSPQIENIVLVETMLIPTINNIQQVESGIKNGSLNIEHIAICISLVISCTLLFRLMYNIFRLNKKCNTDENTILYKNYKIVLIDGLTVPHSFWKTTFINKRDYEANKVSEKILEHELTHIKQKHTLDIVAIELVLTIFWFNPIFYLYKRAIKLNHEFLADEYIVNRAGEITDYQQMLLEYASNKKSYNMASNLNYRITKKRLIMMTKKTSKHRRILYMLLCLPFSFGTAYAFGSHIQQGSIPQEHQAVDSTKKSIDKSFWLPNPVFFQEKEIKIDEDGEKTIKQVADLLSKNPKFNVIITGYASANISDEEAETLSRERAKNTSTILVEKYKIPAEKVGIDWRGKSAQPFYDEKKNNAVLFYIDIE